MTYFKDEKMSLFLTTVGYFNAVAKDRGDVFEYELDEVKKTGSFLLFSKKRFICPSSYAGKAFRYAVGNFDLKILPAGESVLIRGTMDLS